MDSPYTQYNPGFQTINGQNYTNTHHHDQYLNLNQQYPQNQQQQYFDYGGYPQINPNNHTNSVKLSNQEDQQEQQLKLIEQELAMALDQVDHSDISAVYNLYSNVLNNAQLASQQISSNEPLKKYWYRKVLEYQIKEKNIRDQILKNKDKENTITRTTMPQIQLSSPNNFSSQQSPMIRMDQNYSSQNDQQFLHQPNLQQVFSFNNSFQKSPGNPQQLVYEYGTQPLIASQLNPAQFNESPMVNFSDSVFLQSPSKQGSPLKQLNMTNNMSPVVPIFNQQSDPSTGMYMMQQALNVQQKQFFEMMSNLMQQTISTIRQPIHPIQGSVFSQYGTHPAYDQALNAQQVEQVNQFNDHDQSLPLYQQNQQQTPHLKNHDQNPNISELEQQAQVDQYLAEIEDLKKEKEQLEQIQDNQQVNTDNTFTHQDLEDVSQFDYVSQISKNNITPTIKSNNYTSQRPPLYNHSINNNNNSHNALSSNSNNRTTQKKQQTFDNMPITNLSMSQSNKQMVAEDNSQSKDFQQQSVIVPRKSLHNKKNLSYDNQVPRPSQILKQQTQQSNSNHFLKNLQPEMSIDKMPTSYDDSSNNLSYNNKNKEVLVEEVEQHSNRDDVSQNPISMRLRGVTIESN